MRNISDESFGENKNVHFIFNNFFSPKIVTFLR